MEEKEIINENQENIEEIKEENQPVEEQPTQVEEVKPVEESKAVDIAKPSTDSKPYAEVVEEERNKVVSQNKLSSRLSTVSILVVLALSITGIFLLQVVPVVSYVLMGVAVVSLITFSIVIKRIVKPDVQGYIVRASNAINEYVFADNRFQNMKYDPTDKLQLEDIANDGAFEGLVRVASRNVCEGTFEDRSFKVCETAFFKAPQGRRQVPAFIGKYIALTNNLHFEGRVIIISKGETDADIPDGIADLVQLDANEKFFIYGPNENALKEIDKKFIKAIKDIEVKGHFMNLTVILWAGRTIIYASYDDPTITLPFYEKYQEDTAVKYRENLVDILTACQIINRE